ncbi:MAG: hypothetical protein E7288_02160 [Lachnospiraceae bacterium]|nr:hypothetical protein [Lachnospiraceae bacterium]
MIKRSLAVILTGLMMITSTYPVNAMGANATFEIQQEEEASEDVSEELSEEEISEENTEAVSEDVSGEASEDASEEETGEGDSEGVSEECSEEATEDNSEEVSEEATEDNSEEISEEATEDVSEESSEETSEESAAYNAKFEKARDALRKLASEQDLMALVYLTESYEMKETPEADGVTVQTVYSGDTVAVRDVAVSENALWYEVTFLGEVPVSGYIERANLVYSDEMLLAWERQYLGELLQLDVAQIAAVVERAEYGTMEVNSFPESYRTYINDMKADHPNWHFVPFNVAVDFDVAAENEVGERSLIHSSVDDSWKGEYHSPNWYYAKPFIIRHFMDPRNFLDETNVFQFEQLTYNKSYHNQDTVKQLLSKSFMAGDVPNEGVSYAAVFMQAGIESTVSPYHLASRVMQEQGAGTSPLISGTHSKYPGYYNYFNIKASGKTNEEIITNGLKYAKEQGWNTRYKSIVGGSQFIGTGYIKVGQDTLYLQKFDMVGTLYTHQYMQNIMAPTTEGKSIASAYKSAGATNKSFVFKVPVYQNMPAVPCPSNQGTITFMREVYNDGGLVSYEVCKSYKEDKKGPQIKLVPFMDNSSEPANSADFTWAVSDKSIVSVTNEGIVNFLKPGTATVSATYKGGDSSYKGKKATCKITVYGIWFEDGSDTEAVQYALRIGSTQTVQTAVKLPDSTKDKTKYWKVENEKIATVSAKGVLTAVAPGITKLTLTAGAYSQSIRVVVLPKTFAAEQDVYYLKATQEQKINVNFENASIPEDVMELLSFTYESDNTQVVKVSNEGILTAVSPGETTIRITAQGMSATCKVNVAANVSLVEKTANGDKITTLYIPYGQCAGEGQPFPVPAEREGYAFMGWYEGADGSGAQYTADTVFYQNSKAYAYFRKMTEGFFVKPIGDMRYTGAALKPEVWVYDGAKQLELNKDYKVSYKYNKDASPAGKKTAVVTVKGIGNYSGTQKVYFGILPVDVSTDLVSAEDLTVVATGKQLKNKPVVKFGTKKLAYNKDYTLEWRNTAEGAYKNPGTYVITVVGKKNFTGERSVKINITDKILMSKCSISNIAKQSYQNGLAVCPDVTVKYKSKILLEGKDYRITYLNNREIGTAQVVIRGIGAYAGVKTKNFAITGIALSKAKISGIVTKEYTGEAIVQNAVLTYGGKTLVKDKDYKVAYSKNVTPGKATITFTGINSYSGTVKKTFTITPYSMKRDQAKVIKISAPQAVSYTKGGAKPKPVVSYCGEVLTEGVDYTLSYKNNKSVTASDAPANKMPQILLKGKGRFKETVSVTFTIKQASVGQAAISVEDAVYSAKANAFRKAPVLIDTDGKKLQAGKDYEKTFRYLNPDGSEIAAGTILPAGSEIKIVVTGKGNYTGSISTVYRVVNASVSKAKVKIKDQVYTGKEVVPAKSDIEIRIGKDAPLKSSDYEIIAVENNVKKGTATVTIRGLDNYGGTKKVKFKIVSKSIFH